MFLHSWLLQIALKHRTLDAHWAEHGGCAKYAGLSFFLTRYGLLGSISVASPSVVTEFLPTIVPIMLGSLEEEETKVMIVFVTLRLFAP